MATTHHAVKLYQIPASVVIATCSECGQEVVWQRSYTSGALYKTKVVVQNGVKYTARNLFHTCPKVPQQMSLPTVRVTLNAAGILALFDKAAQHLKYPKIRLQTPSGQPVQLYRSGPKSKHPGQLAVTDGMKYGFNKFFGRIDQAGTFFAGSHSHPELVSLLEELSKDPAGVASRYGKLTGNCCFCGLPLSDERSTAVGYGKICAGHYQLPWG
jgi:hypothetical protein